MSEKSSEQRHRDDIVSQNRIEYATAGMDNAQCPECGDRERITETKAKGKARPVPRSHRARCNECGHSDDPLAFHHAYKWAELTDEEREKRERLQARTEARMADWEADGRP